MTPVPSPSAIAATSITPLSRRGKPLATSAAPLSRHRHSMLLTPINHRGIKLTKDEDGHSSINGVKVTVPDAYRVEDKTVFHLLEYSLDPRTGPRVLLWEKTRPRPLPRDVEYDLKSLRTFDTACGMVVEMLKPVNQI